MRRGCAEGWRRSKRQGTVGAELISIVGPPAAGKTTLAEILAAELPAEILYEDYRSNPFLADSYAGKAKAHLPAQLYYLMSRVKQLAQSAWPGSGLLVSDYGFCQDRIYAAARLRGDELHLYGRIADHLEGLVHEPDLMIHLDASEPTLLKRIAARGRDFERTITRGFLSSVREAIDKSCQAARCEIVRLDCDGTDLRSRQALSELLGKIREKL